MKGFPDAKELHILVDSGGCNSGRSRVWKYGTYLKMEISNPPASLRRIAVLKANSGVNPNLKNV